MFLSDQDIKGARESGDLVIEPFCEQNLQAASYDITLASDIKIPQATGLIYGEQLKHHSVAIPDTGYVLDPGQFILAATVERVRLSAGIGAQVMGRSSWGRRGLAIHITAGWVDPGWDGVLTLELFNCGPAPVLLLPGARIGQLVFGATFTDSAKPYHGRYWGAKGVESVKLAGPDEGVVGDLREAPTAY